jgi:hypothetical protein
MKGNIVNNDERMAIAEGQRERAALMLESYAASMRNADSDDMRTISNDVAELAATIGRLYADTMARAEYYECSICTSDFHTAAQRNGRECREYRQAAIIEGMRHAARVANN